MFDSQIQLINVFSLDTQFDSGSEGQEDSTATYSNARHHHGAKQTGTQRKDTNDHRKFYPKFSEKDSILFVVLIKQIN